MYRTPTVTGRKPGLKSSVWSSRKEKNIQSKQNEEARTKKKMRRGLGTSGPL